jgi:NAD-dependent deacetylase
MEEARALATLIARDGPCVVLTGAGMSTESGIPDFRSATGIWADIDPFEVASIDAFRRDPERVWDFYRMRLDVLGDARPNPGHHALAALEAAGHVTAIVTQNVDTLHEQAGSRDVVEVHGSLREAVCVCGGRMARAEVSAVLARGDLPRCDRCERVLKPGVVMFGEMLPGPAMQRAERLAREASLMLVVGSSLQVWPVAGLPGQAVAGGATLVIVNNDPTPVDDRATLLVRGPAGVTLRAAADLVLAGAV